MEVVDSVEDFRSLDSHKVMECRRRIFDEEWIDNFARSLVTEIRTKRFSGKNRCGFANNSDFVNVLNNVVTRENKKKLDKIVENNRKMTKRRMKSTK